MCISEYFHEHLEIKFIGLLRLAVASLPSRQTRAASAILCSFDPVRNYALHARSAVPLIRRTLRQYLTVASLCVSGAYRLWSFRRQLAGAGSLCMLVGLQPYPGALVNGLQGENVPLQFARKYDWSHNNMLLRGRTGDGCFRRRSVLNQAVMGIFVVSSAVVFSSSGFGRSSY